MRIFFFEPDKLFFIYRINAELYFTIAPKLNHSINIKIKKMKKVILILIAAMFSTVMFAQTQDTKKTEPKKEPVKTETVKPADKKATATPVKPVKKQTPKKKIVKKTPPQAAPAK